MAAPNVTARRILGYVWPHRGRLLGAFACMAVLAGTTQVFAFLTGPLLTFLLTGQVPELGWLADWLPAWTPDLLAGLDRDRALHLLPLLLLTLTAVRGGAYLGQFYLMGMLGQRVVVDLRRALFQKLLGLSPAWYEQQRSGDLLSRFSADVAAVELFATYGIASVLRDGLTVLALLVGAFALSWKLSLLALLVVPLAALPGARLAARLRTELAAGQAALGHLGARVQEGLWGLRVLQAYGAEEAELARFDREADEYLRQAKASVRSKALAPALLEVLVVAALVGALALAAQAVGRGQMSREALTSFLTTLILIYQPARDLGRVGPWLLGAVAGAERIFAVLDAPDPLAPAGSAALPPLQRELRLRQVTFAYGADPVLRGLDLALRQGEVVGLVGESGGGKSTVVKLLLRFLDPQQGAVEADGVDLRTARLDDARAQCALVTQEPLLFHDSVRANLAYARPGVSQAELEEAARAARAHEFITALPQGYETPIGERGVRLSGGQKQRLALARALLSRAPVLVLDEATSSLDPESEREVQAVLDQLLVGRTALIIAHRVSAVRKASRICVLKAGRIVEEGGHRELLARGGEYARICALQGEA